MAKVSFWDTLTNAASSAAKTTNNRVTYQQPAQQQQPWNPLNILQSAWTAANQLSAIGRVYAQNTARNYNPAGLQQRYGTTPGATPIAQQVTRNYNPGGLTAKYAGANTARQQVPQYAQDEGAELHRRYSDLKYRDQLPTLNHYYPFYWSQSDMPGVMGFQLGVPPGIPYPQQQAQQQAPQEAPAEAGYLPAPSDYGYGGYGGGYGGYGGGGGGGSTYKGPNPEWYEAMVNWRYG